MSRRIVLIPILFMVLLAVAACGRKKGPALRASGDLFVNGVGITGSVFPDSPRIFYLKQVLAGYTYALRTQIADGTLSLKVYPSLQSYIDNKNAPTWATSDPVSADHPDYYEVLIDTANTPSGDYIVEVSGTPASGFNTQYFSDLRIVSASLLTSFATNTLTFPVTDSRVIVPGYVNVYSGATITPPGTYTVKLSLVSSGVATVSCPQMFVYKDSSFTVGSLLYSSLATTLDYSITDMTSGTTTTSESNTLPPLNFSDSGPFIMLKGIAQVEYTLSVGP